MLSDILRAAPVSTIDQVLSIMTSIDGRLPDTDGVALLRQVHARRPDLPVIVTTAYTSIEPQLAVLDLPYASYLLKPFDLDDLAARIDAA